jgi:gluconate 2-dehydrogenase gamma chain
MIDPDSLSRRQFLQAGSPMTAASYLRILAPAAVAISQAACSARDEEAPFLVLGADEARDLAAIAARILPTTETPGANEAGVIYFIDRAFAEEMSGQLELAREQLSALNNDIGESRFSDLGEQAQDEFLHGRQSSPLFNMMWAMTMFGFFSMPKHGGNRDKVGWDLIGFEGDHGPWTYPFGHYDAEVHGDTNDGE